MKKKALSPSLDSLLSALPDVKTAHRKWTLQEDAALLKYIPSKGFSAVARALNTDRATVTRRYAFLTGKQNGK